MKKIVVTVAVMAAFSFGASAQEGKQAPSAPAPEHHEAQVEKKDEIMLKDGKLQARMDGKVTPVEKDITLKNGTVVLANGTVKTPDGKTVTLKEGDCVNMEGKIWNKKEAHDQKVLQGNMENK
jgi:D-lyxose ketol-isomerase